MKLFDIGTELDALSALLDETGGEITEANTPAVDAWFAELQSAQGTKIDNYLSLISRLEGEAAAARAETDRYEKAAKVRSNSVSSLKRRLLEYLLFTGQTKVVTATARTVSVVNHGGQQPIIWTDGIDKEDISDEFAQNVVERKIDNKAVRAALESGRELAFAKLGPRGQRLGIK